MFNAGKIGDAGCLVCLNFPGGEVDKQNSYEYQETRDNDRQLDSGRTALARQVRVVSKKRDLVLMPDPALISKYFTGEHESPSLSGLAFIELLTSLPHDILVIS
jgi:hypothetical protein